MKSTELQSEQATKMVLIAALVGGVISMRFVDDMSRKERLFAIISGCAMAHYIAPLIASLFAEGQYEETMGFLIGLFGMSICSTVFKAIKNSDLWGLIEKRFSRNEDA